MSPLDVDEMRAHQRREEAEMRGDSDDVRVELENLQWIAEKKALLYEGDDIVVLE
ncbi:hypothetical protein D9M68_980890 [compost metagenome]